MLHISYCVFHVSVFYFYGLNIFCLNNVSENATKNEAMSPFVARYNPFRIWRKDFPCIRNSEIRRKILLWDVWQHGPNWATQIWIDSHWLTNPSPLFVVGSRFPTWRREGIEFPIWYDLVACTCFPASLCMLITSWHVIHRGFTTKKDPRPAGAHLFVTVLGAWFQHHRVIVWRSNSIGVKFFTSLWRPFLARTGANSNDSENLVWPSLQDTRGTDRNFNEMFQHPFVKTSYHIGYFCPLNTDPWFDCYYDFVSFVQQWCHLHFFIFRLYIFPTLCSAFHFLCPEWAAALHTKSKLKNVLSSGCPPDFVPRKLFGSRDCFTGHCTWLLPSQLPADRRVLAWSRGFGGFCEDLADGRSVAPKSLAIWKLSVKERSCEGLHGRMRGNGPPHRGSGRWSNTNEEWLGPGEHFVDNNHRKYRFFLCRAWVLISNE